MRKTVLPALALLLLPSAACTARTALRPTVPAQPFAKASPPSGATATVATVQDHLGYADAIAKTVAMVSDSRAQSLAQARGLNLVNVTWEDTGRFGGSAVGPNISDVTIQVQHKLPGRDDYQLSLMPVIRHPNFSDKTGDIAMEDFKLLVGNEDGTGLRQINLRQLLKNPRKYMSNPGSWKGPRRSLLARRDTHVLVSAQAAFLPVPKQGIAEFNPVIFNYQSTAGDPAVLAIVVTREGTSMTVIDNSRDGFAAGSTWGQRLFFNQKGERASLTGQRISDFVAEQGTQELPGNGGDTASAGGEIGLNMVMLIQVPLKQKKPMRAMPEGMVEAEAPPAPTMMDDASDVEQAVIGHGEVEGPFTEFDGLDIERDPRFPVRVTVQFYKATSNGVVSERDLDQVREQIDRVYEDADYVGSLVDNPNAARPTAHDGPKVEPPGWWGGFWQQHEANTGQSEAQAMQMLRALHGHSWTPRSRGELRRALRKAR